MKRIIFFDGVCPVCNGFVDYVLKKDFKNDFLFCSLQSEFARGHLPEKYQKLDTIILMENNDVFDQSTAVLRILFQLGGHWNALAVFASAVPRPLRDFVYRIIAKNRYRFFGKRDVCRLPSPEEKERFLL